MEFRHGVRSAKARLVELRAKVNAAQHGARTPPGNLTIPDRGRTVDQTLLLERARELGPIFKVWLPHKYTTCIVGHELARRFLSENEGKIRAGTPDLSPLFPHGFLRALEGPVHRKYRKQVLDAFNNTPLDGHVPEIRAIIREGLETLSAAPQPVDNDEIRRALKKMTTAVFLRIILGVSRDHPRYEEFAQAYDIYAPNGPFIVVREENKPAYRTIRNMVFELAEEIGTDEAAPPSLLKHLVRTGTLDETTAGNLIQMVEATRYDLHGLWCWITKHLGDNPEAFALARNAEKGASGTFSAIEAIPRESLRMEQSELLLRVATEDIVFDGYFIPRKSHIRICVWEAHHDPDRFPEPFHYECRRFMEKKIPANDYSPFGLDKHRCLGADWTYFLSSLFVEELVEGFDYEIIGDGKPVFGKFHFQPSNAFSISIGKRASAQNAGGA